MPRRTPCWRSSSQLAGNDGCDHRQHRVGIVAQEGREIQEAENERIDLGAEIRQHAGELRQHEGEKEQQHAAGGAEHEQRIADGVAEPPLQRLGAAALVGQHFEHLIQRSGRFADADQRHIHRGKQPLMPRQGLGETFAGDDARADIGDHRPQPAEIAVGGEQFEAVIDPRARAQQQRKIAGENGDVFRLGLVEQAEDALPPSRPPRA